MSDSSIPPDPEDDAVITDIFLGHLPENDLSAEFSSATEEDLKEFSADDGKIDSGFEEEPVQVGDGACIVCGAPTFRPPGLTKAGHRKRTPKYCDIHNPKLRVSQEGSQFAGVETQFKRIQEELADDIRLLGVMAGPLLPVTGIYVYEAADPFTTALLKLCKNNPRAIRILHRAAEIAPIYEVAKDLAGVFYAVQVDMQKLDPHNTVSQRLGVARAYDNVYPSTETNVMNNGAPRPQGPPRYASVQ